MKRTFDLLSSIVGLIVLSPLFLFIGVAVKLDSPGPVFFRQDRVGLGGRLFRIHKFRTMTVGAEAKGPQVTSNNDRRVTKIGESLRKYKLDELPQLIDVIIGDMSLVGPRPEVPRFIAEYTEADRQIVLSVRPGITDFAAIEFKNENQLLQSAGDPEREYIEKILPIKIGYYKKYVEEQSFITDLSLIFRTIKEIIS